MVHREPYYTCCSEIARDLLQVSLEIAHCVSVRISHSKRNLAPKHITLGR